MEISIEEAKTILNALIVADNESLLGDDGDTLIERIENEFPELKNIT